MGTTQHVEIDAAWFFVVANYALLGAIGLLALGAAVVLIKEAIRLAHDYMDSQ